MKIFTTAFTLCVLHPTNAFLSMAPKRAFQPLREQSWSGEEPRISIENVSPVGPSPATGGLSRKDPLPQTADYKSTHELFEELTPVKVQGSSLRTCSFDENVDRISVFLKTEGRPLNAMVELWQGPDNVPQKMGIYIEDASLRPFRASIESPGAANAVAIRNTGQMEFPLTAGLECDMSGADLAPSKVLLSQSNYRTVQGGAVYTTPFPPAVQSVHIALKSDGRPLNARVELLQGPNNNKEVMEIYTEDGSQRPLYAVIDTPGSGNVVRIVNTATVEFPLTAAVEPYIVDDSVVAAANDSGGGMTWS